MRLLYLYICYFTFGWSFSFGAVAMQFVMINTLKFTPVELTMSYGILSAPWTMKPLYGMVSDKFEVFDWGRRRPYISITGLIAACMYVHVNHFMASKTYFIAALTFISANLCFADVCADSITVDIVKDEAVEGRTQSYCWIFRSSGTLLGAFFGGMAYKALGATAVFQIVAVMPLVMSMGIWKLPMDTGTPPRNMLRQLIHNLKNQKSLALVFLCMSIAPDYGPLYVYYLTRHMGYTPMQFSWMSMSASLTMLLSTIMFNACMLKRRASMVIIVGIIGATLFRATQLLVVWNILPYFSVVLFDGVAESFFGQLIMMPLIIMAAKGCSEGVEGTLYALFMSLSNLSNICGDWLGGVLGSLFHVNEQSFDNLHWVMIISIVLNFSIRMAVILNTSFFYDRKTMHKPRQKSPTLTHDCV
jgi:predicted MFS family arabinose efflux permease